MAQVLDHPKFNSLINHFNQFSQVGFPRGIPQPSSAWRSLVQSLTQYESRVVKQAYEYLRGHAVVMNELRAPVEFREFVAKWSVHSLEDSVYLKKLQDYEGLINHIAELIRNCIEELGNPPGAT